VQADLAALDARLAFLIQLGLVFQVIRQPIGGCGATELGALAVSRACLDAQRGYAGKVRNANEAGKHAPGGKYDYIINGYMIGSFALVAWRAEWGNSGIMTFIVNQQGKIYEKNLGPKTEALAKAMTRYEPDSSWSVVKGQ
jgi:hypothetical protein